MLGEFHPEIKRDWLLIGHITAAMHEDDSRGHKNAMTEGWFNKQDQPQQCT